MSAGHSQQRDRRVPHELRLREGETAKPFARHGRRRGLASPATLAGQALLAPLTPYPVAFLAFRHDKMKFFKN